MKLNLKALKFGDYFILIVQYLGMVGAGSGAVVVAALGNFLLSGILVLIAFGIFLRFKRGKTNKAKI